jgi:hypothetical protein
MVLENPPISFAGDDVVRGVVPVDVVDRDPRGIAIAGKADAPVRGATVPVGVAGVVAAVEPENSRSLIVK